MMRAGSVDIVKTFNMIAHGGIREMSVLEPQPGQVGLTNVISTRVQPSPLSKQFPAGISAFRTR
jgi:hypothetical protein